MVFIFLIALTLRWWYLPQKAVTFAYDQARDAFVIKQIIDGHIKIQGPSANAPGLNHGVFYYYFLTIPYLISNGNPVAADYWLAMFSAATVFVVFFLCNKLTNNKGASLLASLFFAFSFRASQYATWLSNPAMAIWFVPLTYLFLWLWTNKRGNNWLPFFTGIFLGLSIQSDLFLVYHGIAILIWLLINKQNVMKKQIFGFLAGTILGISTILISEIKFGFQGIHGIIYLFSGGDQLLIGKGLGDFIVIYFNELGGTLAGNIFPLSVGFGGFVGLVMIIWLIFHYFGKAKKDLICWEIFLLIYIFSSLPVAFFGGMSSPYLTAGIDIAVCILVGLVVSKIWTNSKLLAIIITLVILTSGVVEIFSQNKFGQTIFATRQEMTLSNLEQVVDYTYQSSNGNKFSINSITAPLWMNTTWSYIYNWYGVKKYGVLPYWHGRNQIGSLGNNLPNTPPTVTTWYMIIEPEEGIPQQFINQDLSEEDSKSKVQEQVNIKGFVIEKRTPIIK